jgi:acyl carrier protein
VAQGYWDDHEENDSTFGNRVQDTGETPFLRTGDLGFVLDDQLYVTGRLKDLLIIRGRNHYPHDIELTMQQAHACLLPSAGAAFSVNAADREELALVQEVDRAYRETDFDEVIRAIRRAVTEEHEVDAHGIVLIRQASLSRTTSGKVQRHLCRQQYLDDELKVLAKWARPSVPSDTDSVDGHRAKTSSWEALPFPTSQGGTLSDSDKERLAEQIETQLLVWLHERGGVPEEDLDRDRPFAEFGIDSLTAVELSTELEAWSGVQMSSVVAWKYPTPATLSRYLACEIGQPSKADRDAEPPEPSTPNDFERLLAEVENMSEEDAAIAVGQETANSREF